MAFERVRAIRGAGTSGVRVSIRKISTTTPLKVFLSLGPDVLKKTGWTAGQVLEVLRGTDADLGQVLLRPGSDAEGYHLRQLGDSKNGNRLSIATALWSGLPEEKQKIAACSWSFGTDGLLITLPTWAGRPPKRFDDRPSTHPPKPSAKPYPAFA